MCLPDEDNQRLHESAGLFVVSVRFVVEKTVGSTMTKTITLTASGMLLFSEHKSHEFNE